MVLGPARVKTAHRSFYNTFRVAPRNEGAALRSWQATGIHQITHDAEASSPERQVSRFEVEMSFRDRRRTMLLNARVILWGKTRTQQLVLLAMRHYRAQAVEVAGSSNIRKRKYAQGSASSGKK